MRLPSSRRLVAVAAVAGLVVYGLFAAAPSRAATGLPTFTVTHAPDALAGSHDSGEPSVGANVVSGNTMYQSGLATYRVAFDPAGNASFKVVSAPLTSTTSLDPILHTDRATHRTFVSQLVGACSLLAYTDDDGATYTQNPIGCGIGALADHQTIGGGTPAAGPTGTTVGYRDITYYCAQSIVSAQCAASRDGGLTFGPGVPIYTLAQCGGLHGHVVVAPNDGTAYVPNADCGGKQGVSMSKNNGTTWSVLTVPGSKTQSESDPSVGVGSAGSAYFGYAQDTSSGTTSSSAPYASVLRGGTFSTPVDVSGGSIKNVQFPTVVAGDDGRAAMAYLGTATAGDDQAPTFTGTWNLYVAQTTDGGRTWTNTQANPSADPVQKGCIFLGGGSNPCRNLLDFMGVTVDRTGNVVVGYADGCNATCASGGTNSHDALATVAKQTGGTSLFAAFDAAPTTGATVLAKARTR